MSNSISSTTSSEGTTQTSGNTISNKYYAIAMFALSFGTFAIGIAQFAAMSMLNSIVQEFHRTLAEGHALTTCYSIGAFVGAPVLAILTAKVDRKKLLISLLAFYALCTALTASAPTYTILLLARFLAGLVHGTYFGTAYLVAIYISPSNKAAKAVSWINVGFTLATLLGVPVAQYLGTDFTWRMSYWIGVIFTVITMILIFFTLPSTKGIKLLNPLKEITITKNINIWLTLFISTIGFGATFAIWSFNDIFFHQVAHLKEDEITIGLALFGIGMLLGGLLGGRIADHSNDAALFFGMIAQIIITIIFPFLAHHGVWLLLAAFLIGLMGQYFVPALQSRLIVSASGHASSLAAALNQSAFNLSNAIGPGLAGEFLAVTHDNFNVPAYVAFALSIGGLFTIILAHFYMKAKPPLESANPFLK